MTRAIMSPSACAAWPRDEICLGPRGHGIASGGEAAASACEVPDGQGISRPRPAGHNRSRQADRDTHAQQILAIARQWRSTRGRPAQVASRAMKVFLSYASEQAEIARAIEIALRGEGHVVFLDRSSLVSGETYN